MLSGKESTCQAGEVGSIPELGRYPGEENGNPLLPGKSHGQRSLAGYSPWGRKESDMTERLHTHTGNAGDIRHTDSIPWLGISPGGGYDNPLQDSCLENSMDRGAWWATVHGLQTVGHD